MDGPEPESPYPFSYGQHEISSQFEVAGQVGDAVRGGDDVSVADEGAAALELHVRAARDDVAEVGQPRVLADLRVLKHRCALLLYSRDHVH